LLVSILRPLFFRGAARDALTMRKTTRRLRAAIAMRSTRMRMKTQLAWYWRWAINGLLATGVALVAYWVFQNQHRLTGFNPSEMRDQLVASRAETTRLASELETIRRQLAEREQQNQIDRAAQTELGKTLTQLQEENATLKEELGFLRNLMSSDRSAEGIAINNLKVERDAGRNVYRYRMLLTQGGQRKQDFVGRVQIVARIVQAGQPSVIAYPDDATVRGSAASTYDVEFRYYQKVDGRVALPADAALKSVEVRILSNPGGQLRASRQLNITP
jgi:transposase-like protein